MTKKIMSEFVHLTEYSERNKFQNFICLNFIVTDLKIVSFCFAVVQIWT